MLVIRELGSGDLTGDVLRVHSAVEHCRGVAQGILSVHAVAMARGDYGVLLFGGHGAGKSVTGLALAARGWHALAGDVALIQCADHAGRPKLVGGTRRFLLRPSSPAVRELYLPAPSTQAALARVDATSSVPWVALGDKGIEARLAVNVVVDSRARHAAGISVLDEHTSQSVWWRASGYLLDRVLDDPAAQPLRTMEPPALTAARMDLARWAARLLPVYDVFGTAGDIAEAIELELMEECV